MATRRLNYMDLTGIVVFSEVWEAGHYWSAALALAAFLVISVTIETKVGR